MYVQMSAALSSQMPHTLEHVGSLVSPQKAEEELRVAGPHSSGDAWVRVASCAQ